MLKGLASLLVSILVVSISAAEKKFTPLDLSAHVQKRWSDIEPNTSWASVPAGMQDFGGVPFKTDGIVEVTGMGAAQAGQPKPAQVTGISADAKASHIHILHGTGWDAPDGTPIAVLTLNYANGESRSMPILYGVHVRNWWQEPHEATGSITDRNSEVAWSGGSAETDPRGVKLRLFRSAFVNPLPGQEIRTIDFVSLFSRATPVMVGLALEHGTPGDLAEAERVAAQGKEYLENLPAGVTLEVRMANSNQKPTEVSARARAISNGRPIDLGTFRGKEGRVRILFPEISETLEYSVQGPDFVTHRGVLDTMDDVLNTPLQITVNRGATIGGKVQNAAGGAISGAKVSISAITRDAVGQFISEQIAQVETDAAGAWKSASVPADFSFLSFAVTHPEHRPADYEQGDETDEGIVTKSDLLGQKAVMVLRPAPVISGVVKNAEGVAVADATVAVRADDRTALHASSDAKGAFRLVLPDVDEVDVIVQAAGLAPIKRRVEITNGQATVPLTLQTGNTLKGRVLDSAGAPLERVLVSVVSWNDLPVLNWRAETDAEGRFSWDSAPADPVVLSFAKAGFQSRTGSYAASGEEVEVRIGKTFQLSGTVLDAETKEPVSAFRIVPGFSWGGPEEDSTQWQPEDVKHGRDGKYLVDNIPMRGGEMRFMVQAEGYQPVASPSYPPAGWHRFDATLKKGKRPAGIVMNKEGKPVQYVQIVTLGSDHVMLSAGKFRSYNRNRNYEETDSEGQFRLEEALGTAKVIFVHEEFGCAESTIDKLRTEPKIVLQPWAKIDGQLKIGSKNAGAGHELMLAQQTHGPGALAFDYDTFRKTTDENGRFSYDFVPPGERMLVRLIPIGRGSGWSHYTRFTIAPGETKQVQVGGTGRPIVGKLAASDPNREIKWNSGHHSLSKRFPKPPRFNSQEEYKEWMKTPEVVEAQRDPRNYTLEVKEDGSFRISDVLPGDYTLRVNLMEPSDEQGFNERMIASLSQDVTVEEIPGGQTDEPLDLGTLTIQLKNDLRTGMMAPPIEAKTLEDEPFALKELKGKYVLLDFWATWCGPCVAEIPNLKAAFEKHGKNPNFVMVGLSLDQEVKEPREFVKKRNLPWTQLFLGEWSQTKIPDRYGVNGIPATFLIDPQGRVIEMNLRGENLVRTLDRILTQTASAE